MDLSLALYMFIQNSLGINVFEACGSEEQKQRIIPGLIDLTEFSCFGLTEPDHGSDATGMKTTATKVEGGYILNGKKRWPGNGVRADFSIIWAKNASEGNKIQGFIVEKGSKGHSAKPITGKIGARLLTK